MDESETNYIDLDMVLQMYMEDYHLARVKIQERLKKDISEMNQQA